MDDKFKCRGGFALLELCAAFAVIAIVSASLALTAGICLKTEVKAELIRRKTNLIVSTANALDEKPIGSIEYLDDSLSPCAPENAEYILLVTEISKERVFEKSLAVFEIKIVDTEGQTLERLEKTVLS